MHHSLLDQQQHMDMADTLPEGERVYSFPFASSSLETGAAGVTWAGLLPLLLRDRPHRSHRERRSVSGAVMNGIIALDRGADATVA